MALDDIKTYQKMLAIQKHRLDDELEMQGEILHRISEQVVKAKSRALAAKDELDRIEGKIYSESKEDSPKATVPELQGLTLRDPERITVWNKYQLARHEQEDWEGLHEAWRSRGFALRALVDLRLANYYTSDSGGGEDYTSSREALNAARKTAAEHKQEPAAPRRRTLMDD